MKHETQYETVGLEPQPDTDQKVTEVEPEDAPKELPVFTVVTEQPEALQTMIEQAERVSAAFTRPAILENAPMDAVDDLEPIDRFFYRMSEYVTKDLRERAAEYESAEYRDAIMTLATADLVVLDKENRTLGDFLSYQNRPQLYTLDEFKYDDNFIAISDEMQIAFTLAMATMPEADGTLTALFNICEPVFAESTYRRDTVSRRDRALYADMHQLLKIYTLSALYAAYEDFEYNEDMLFEWQYAMFHYDFVAKLQEPERYQELHDLVLDLRVQPDSILDEDFEPEVWIDEDTGPLRVTLNI